MLWRIRTELADRPGALAELAARCGADDINILSLEVFTAESGALDELVVSTGVGWTAERADRLAAEAGCADDGAAVPGRCPQRRADAVPPGRAAADRRPVHR